jgi:hypothetical protein
VATLQRCFQPQAGPGSGRLDRNRKGKTLSNADVTLLLCMAAACARDGAERLEPPTAAGITNCWTTYDLAAFNFLSVITDNDRCYVPAGAFKELEALFIQVRLLER